jgi:hypothetical protein
VRQGTYPQYTTETWTMHWSSWSGNRSRKWEHASADDRQGVTPRSASWPGSSNQGSYESVFSTATSVFDLRCKHLQNVHHQVWRMPSTVISVSRSFANRDVRSVALLFAQHSQISTLERPGTSAVNNCRTTGTATRASEVPTQVVHF